MSLEKLGMTPEIEQQARLGKVTAVASGFGAMLYIDRPGDVSFLAPIAPELRGIEIVSASPARADGKDYDIWHQPESGPPKMVESDMTLKEVVDWLRQTAHTDEEIMANGAQWAEDTLKFYGAKKQTPASLPGLPGGKPLRRTVRSIEKDHAERKAMHPDWPTHKSTYIKAGGPEAIYESVPIGPWKKTGHCKYCHADHENWWLMDPTDYMLGELEPPTIVLCGKCEHTSRWEFC